MTPLYTASAVATGNGRDGRVESTDGVLTVDVRTPQELGGPGGATNPEQLFAAGYAAAAVCAAGVRSLQTGERVEIDLGPRA